MFTLFSFILIFIALKLYIHLIYLAVNPNQLHILFLTKGYFILKSYLFYVLF